VLDIASFYVGCLN